MAVYVTIRNLTKTFILPKEEKRAFRIPTEAVSVVVYDEENHLLLINNREIKKGQKLNILWKHYHKAEAKARESYQNQ